MCLNQHETWILNTGTEKKFSWITRQVIKDQDKLAGNVIGSWEIENRNDCREFLSSFYRTGCLKIEMY